jgi:hypothetical protein
VKTSQTQRKPNGPEELTKRDRRTLAIALAKKLFQKAIAAG